MRLPQRTKAIAKKPVTSRVAFAIAAGLLLNGCLYFGVGAGTVEVGVDSHVVRAGHLRHIVLVQFAEGTDPGTIAEIEAAAAAMPDRIDAILDFEWGTRLNDEQRAQGFTHCLLITFENQADLDTYDPHPVHEAFKALLGPHVGKLLVFDYTIRE